MADHKDIDSEKLKNFWKEEAEEALLVAEHLVEKEDFSYALFFGHLALEKLLKSLCVQKNKDHAPPIHNLLRLAKVADLNLDPQTENDLLMITAFHIESRYPDYKKSFRDKCTRDFTNQNMMTIERIFKWLKSLLT
jgi:HEPN domain-containing protein